jgi:hypothetical protein
MEDPRSPVLFMGVGNGQSYGSFEQAPMFKNGHTQKAPPGKCLVEESMSWTRCTVLAVASSAPSKLSASPEVANKKKAKRKLDAELKSTQVSGPSMDAAAGGGSKPNKTKPLKKDYPHLEFWSCVNQVGRFQKTNII